MTRQGAFGVAALEPGRLAAPRHRGVLWALRALAQSGSVRAHLGAAFLSALLLGCGASDSTAHESVESDVRAIAAVLARDPARLPLSEVDEAIRDDRPVLAADLIARTAIPATERLIEQLAALEPTSSEGRRLRNRAVRAHRDRIEALRSLEGALARGVGQEDERLLDAMRADARAQMAIVALEDELNRLVPHVLERAPLEERSAFPPPSPPTRERVLEDEPTPERPEEPNPGAAEPIPSPEP